MYKLAEMQVGAQQIRDLSGDITKWYDLPENQKVDGLKAVSLLYRLRDEPMQGYGYFLQQSDKAIRGTKTSLDFSLRDAMGIFVAGAKMPRGSLGDTLRSDIDADIVRAEAPLLEDYLKIDRVTLAIRRLMVRGENARAKEIGDKELERIRRQYEKSPKEFGLDFSEFRLWHGQVIMYGGDHKQALEIYEEARKVAEECKTYILTDPNNHKNLFDRERLYLVLGRLLNNKGYAYWMFEGQYRRAIREFIHAIRFFDEADLKEEKANTLDNMGRSYAALDNRQRADSNIRWGLDIRDELRIQFRLALSRISLVHGLCVGEQFEPAETEVNKALSFVLKGNIKRGVGLASIAKGLVLRKRAEWDFERGLKGEEVERHLRDAEIVLRGAIALFEEVKEPIRSVQAYNELGGVYRAKYLILTNELSRKLERLRAYQDARICYLKAINIAKASCYPIEILDAQQDLAVLYLRSGKYIEAYDELDEIERAIPNNHRIKPNTGLQLLILDEQVDAYYKLMGLVELQRGTMSLLQFGDKRLQNEEPFKTAIQNAMRYFAFAITYLERFGGSHIADVYTFKRIQKRFRDVHPELVKHILEDFLPDIIKEYRLDEKLVVERFESVFGNYA